MARALACAALTFISTLAVADVASGINWLSSHVQSDGSITNDSASIATPFQARAEALSTLKQLGSGAPQSALASIVSNDPGDPNEYLARKVISLAPLGTNVSAIVGELLASQNSDGGFGGDSGYASNPLDTAFVVLALKVSGNSSATATANAVAYLVSVQGADGSFAINEQPSIYVTAYALQALSAIDQAYDTTFAAQAASNWLTSQQSSGSYASVLDNAVAAAAIASHTAQTPAFSSAQAALAAAQSADGSWSQDPYLTAIALRALAATGSTPPAATSGEITGLALDNATGNPVPGVLVQAAGPVTATTNTLASGVFTIGPLAAGIYTLQLSKGGYATLAQSVTVSAGVVSNLGALRLSAATSNAGIQGVIRDGNTNQPIAGALVTAGAISAATDATGSYQITNIAPGAVQISVSKTGYQTINATATLTSGVIVVFSPSLYPPGQGPNATTLTGTVVDGGTSQPIAGALVTVGSATAMTDATGAFTVNGLSSGAVSIVVSANGYNSQTLTGTLVNGSNSTGTIALTRLSSSATISGVVSDTGTAQPIGGATVSVQGTALTATTNVGGAYSIAGVTQTQFTLVAAAAGYQGAAVPVTLPQLANATVNISLARAIANGVSITSVATDAASYPPQTDILVTVALHNAGAVDATVNISATAYDAASNAVFQAFAQPVTVPANGDATASLEGQSGSLPAGTYSLLAQAFDGGGSVVAQRSTSFQVTALAAIAGNVSLDPPLVQAGTNTPVHITANIRNAGNEPLPAGTAQVSVSLTNADPNVSTAAKATLVPGSLFGSPLNQPVGAGFDSSGNFYTVNTADRRVIKYAADGQTSILATLPASFTNPSVTVNPTDAVVDAAGNVYVLNSLSEIFKVDPSGAITRMNGAGPTASGQLSFDRDVAGNFYILVLGNTVTRVDAAGNRSSLTVPGLSGPRGVARASDGSIYVANSGDGSITRVDATSGTISILVPPRTIAAPTGMTFGPGNSLYVANSTFPANVLRVGLDGSISQYATGFNGPNDLAFDSLGNLYVINANDNSVSKVGPGGGTGQKIAQTIVTQPQGMSFDGSGNLFIAGSNLSKLDTTGNPSVVSTSISQPQEVAIGAAGEVYVANGGGSVTKTVGTTTTTFASGLLAPYGLAFDGTSTLYVTESGSNPPRVSALNSSGQRTTVADSVVSSPEAIRIAANGDRYVLNDSYIAVARLGGTGSVVVSSNTLSAQSFALASDGGFWIQESTTIKRITSAGVISVFKSGLPSLGNGIVVDSGGNLLVADTNNKKILRVDTGANVTTLATLPDFPTAIADDLAGGVYVTTSLGNLLHVTAGGAVSTLTTGRIIPSPTRITFDGTSNKIYYTNGSSVFSFDIASATSTSIAANLGQLVAIEYGAGQIHIINRNTSELDTVSLAGQVTPIVNGFGAAQAAAWDGSRLIFGDSQRLYTLTPGGLPHLLVAAPMLHIAYRNGVIYGTSRTTAGAVQTIAVGVDTAPQPYLTAPSGAAMAIAIRPDGALAVSNPNDASLWIYDTSKNLIASYAGVNNPQGIAVDPANNVYVSTGSEIIKLAGSANQSSIFARNTLAIGMAFDASGQLYATSSNSIVKIDSTGLQTTVAPATGGTLFGLVAAPEGIFAADRTNGVLRKVAGGQLTSFASGLTGPLGVRADGQGGVFVANNGNGTIAHLTNGSIIVSASGLVNPRSLIFSADGEMLVASDNGNFYVVDSHGAPTSLLSFTSLYGLGSFQVNSLARNPANGQLAAVSEFRNEMDRIAFTPPGAAPGGTVVFTGSAASPAVPAGATSPAIDFGSWTPQLAGDYAIAVTLPGATGEVDNRLHVGPNATAVMSTGSSKVAPGNPAVSVNVAIDGADFSSVAKVSGSATLVVPLQAINQMAAYGADAAGNTYVLEGNTGKVWRFAPGSLTGQVFFTVPASQSPLMHGEIPFDSNQNAYVVSGSNSTNVVRVSPAGVGTTIATLPGPIQSLTRVSGDFILALTSAGGLYRMASDGSGLQLLPTGTLSRQFAALSADAKGNVYVFDGTVNQVRPDGTRANIVNAGPPYGVDFENEAGAAGDCADNLFIMPAHWKSLNISSNEEQFIVSFITRTGVAASIFDAGTVTQSPNNVVFDRFSNSLLLDDDGSFPRLNRVPVACGAITTDLHVVFPATQPASAFSVAPKAIMTQADGSKEYVWTFADVTNFGKTLTFSTTLQSLAQGETRPIASSAFLSFQNTFVPGSVTVPVKVPTVAADGMVDMALSTDMSQYPANTDVHADVKLVNRDTSSARTGTLTVQITDAQGSPVVTSYQQSTTIAAGATLDVLPPFNTAAYLTGSYLVKASLTDPTSGGVIASASAGFLIVSDAVTVISSVSTDKQNYNAADTVNITARAMNVSVNAIATNLNVRVQVTDPSGQSILDSTANVATLVPQALKDSTFVLRQPSFAAGSYTLTETLSDSTGATIDSHVATFSVLSTVDTGSGVSGSTSAGRFANQGDLVTVTVTASNHGNAALTNLPVTVSVVNASTGALVPPQLAATLNLPQGADQQQATVTWNTAGVPAGTYLVGASIAFTGRTIAIGHAPVTIGVIQPFSFPPVTNAPTGTLVQSQPVTIAGIVAPAAVSIQGGEFSVNGGNTWSGSVGTVLPGASLLLRVLTDSAFNTPTTATVTVAGFSASFTATTVNPDTTPDPFSFASLTNVGLSTLQTSGPITVQGINAPAPITIQGGQYSINGGAYTSAPGTVQLGDTVTIQLTSSAALGTTSVATLTIGGVQGTFSVTTTAVDNVPDAFSFTSQNNVPPSTIVTSNTVAITGINVAVPISVVGGTYSINGGAFASSDGTISNGQTVAVRQTSSAAFSTTTSVVLKISNVTGTFEVTTQGGDTTPDPFSFTAQTGVALNTPVTSNIVTIRGINTAVPISITGGTYSVNGGAFTSAAGNVNALDTVAVRQTSAGSFATTTTATLTVSSVNAPFAVTTKTTADVHATPSLAAVGRLLVLISCKSSDDGNDDASCVTQRAPFVDGYLTTLGISNAVVTTEDVFKSEFRSGRYDSYWISGGAEKIDDDVASELLEAGFRGETVVIDGVHDSRNKVLDDVVGVLYKGKPSHLDTVTLTASFLPSGSFTPSGAKPIRVDLTTGVSQAKFNTGDPAIVTNAYGLGSGLLFAFDLVGTLSAQPSSALLQGVVGQSLEFVAPSMPTAFSGDAYVPLAISLKNNEAVAVTMDVSFTMPAGFLLVSSSPAASQSGLTVTWHVNAVAGATVTLNAAVRAPDASGSYTLPIVVTQSYGTTSVQIGTYPVGVVVKGIDTALPLVISSLQALSVSSAHGDRAARDRAVSSLQAAQTQVGQARWEDAISSLTDAAADLDAIVSLDMSSYRVDVDGVIKQVEERWWAALPVCPGASPCRVP